MNTLKQQILTGERALFKACNRQITDSIFDHGESPLKESSNIKVTDSIFKWKYPFWYSNKVHIQNSYLEDGARAGLWYSNGIDISNTTIKAPKALRRSKNIKLDSVDMPNASETLWMCESITMKDVSANGDYFAMNSNNITADNFRLVGNYSFDGCKNIEITNAKLLSKDAFWNCENVTVKDTFISGEYIGWNSRNLTFINCTIESLQGFCYIDGLTLINCRLLNTTLAFEYCRNIDIDVSTTIDSVKNPYSGIIKAEGIGEIIFDDPQIEPSETTIITLREAQYAI